jgi:hypothetical protein
MATRRPGKKIILMAGLALMTLAAVLPFVAPSFGIKDFGMGILVIPLFATLLLLTRRRSGSGGKSNPHINKELVERLEKLEEFESRPDRDKQIPP